MYVAEAPREMEYTDTMPKYRGWDPNQAVEDYFVRIRDHEKYYETVEETNWPFIRIINVCSVWVSRSIVLTDSLQVGEKIMVNVSGFSTGIAQLFIISPIFRISMATCRYCCSFLVDLFTDLAKNTVANCILPDEHP